MRSVWKLENLSNSDTRWDSEWSTSAAELYEFTGVSRARPFHLSPCGGLLFWFLGFHGAALHKRLGVSLHQRLILRLNPVFYTFSLHSHGVRNQQSDVDPSHGAQLLSLPRRCSYRWLGSEPILGRLCRQVRALLHHLVFCF